MSIELTTSMKIIKGIHVVFSKAWLIGSCLLLWLHIAHPDKQGSKLFGIYMSKTVLLQYVIIPGLAGTLLFALILCGGSHWGFTRYWWIVIKIILGSLAVLGSVLFIMSSKNNTLVYLYVGTVIVVFLISTIITLLKPLGETGF